MIGKQFNINSNVLTSNMKGSNNTIIISGNVKCGNVSGSVQTMSGNVRADKIMGSTHTMSGDITSG